MQLQTGHWQLWTSEGKGDAQRVDMGTNGYKWALGNDGIVTYKAILDDFMQSYVYMNTKLRTFEKSRLDYVILNNSWYC